MKKIALSIVFITFVSPIAAWAIYKPARVLIPQWVGDISCIDTHICIEETARYAEATSLYHAALKQTAGTVGEFRAKPKLVFCSTESCYRSFGFNRASATTIGNFGIVVSPRGWKIHLVSHEMVHHRQAEELGILSLLSKPEWYIEGMAYALSHDPRARLSERWQPVRAEFNAWYSEVGRDNLWVKGREL